MVKLPSRRLHLSVEVSRGAQVGEGGMRDKGNSGRFWLAALIGHANLLDCLSPMRVGDWVPNGDRENSPEVLCLPLSHLTLPSQADPGWSV